MWKQIIESHTEPTMIIPRDFGGLEVIFCETLDGYDYRWKSAFQWMQNRRRIFFP